jgi:hypothetical protein
LKTDGRLSGILPELFHFHPSGELYSPCRQFSCKASIDSADGEGAMSMISSERFPSEAHAKTFGLDWAKAWIDKTTAIGKS